MVLINSRDTDIFRLMSSGPVTLERLRSDMKKLAPKLRQTEMEDAFSRDMSVNAFRNRILKLKKDGYINSQRYGDRGGKGLFALYVLTSRAIDILVEQGYSRSHIRAALPNKWTVSHELQVAEVVRTIKREGIGKLRYSFDLADENYLKSKSKGTKKLPYPDLFIRLHFELRGEMITKAVALELDNNTMEEDRVVLKTKMIVLERGWPTMILCPLKSRIDGLRMAFADYYREEKKKAKEAGDFEQLDRFVVRCYFADTHEFCQKGFLGTQWLPVSGESVKII